MFKAIARKSALVVSLTVLAPIGHLYALTPTTPSAVSGGDPQPTGESFLSRNMPSMLLLLSMFSSVVS